MSWIFLLGMVLSFFTIFIDCLRAIDKPINTPQKRAIRRDNQVIVVFHQTGLMTNKIPSIISSIEGILFFSILK